MAEPLHEAASLSFELTGHNDATKNDGLAPGLFGVHVAASTRRRSRPDGLIIETGTLRFVGVFPLPHAALQLCLPEWGGSNHDVQEVDGPFLLKDKPDPGDDVVKKLDEESYRIRVASKYGERFAALRDAVKSLTGRDPEEHLSDAAFFRDYGLQFVTLNTA